MLALSLSLALCLQNAEPIVPGVIVNACESPLIYDNPDPPGFQQNDHMGAFFASGDWNGDGFEDLAIAGYTKPHTNNIAHEVWLYLGTASGLSATPALTIHGNGESDLLGAALTFLPNYKSEGGTSYDALAIGAPQWSDVDNPAPEDHVGRVYVFFGAASVPSPNLIADDDADIILHGGFSDGAWFGAAVAGGDLDGDGVGDLLVGEPGRPHTDDPGTPGAPVAGHVFGYLASSRLAFAEANESPWSGAWADLFLLGDGVGDRLGRSLAMLDDLDGQPGQEFVAGAPQQEVDTATGPVTHQGPGYALVCTLDPAAPGGASVLQQLDGDQDGEGFGNAVARIPDTNGDAVDELAVGAYRFTYHPGELDEGFEVGRVWVYSGSDYAPLFQAPDSLTGLDTTRLIGESTPSSDGGGFGFSVAGAKDLVGGRGGDVLVGAFQENQFDYVGACGVQDEYLAGAAYVIDGNPGATTLVPLELRGERFKDHVGFGVLSMDVDGDGDSDLISGGMAWTCPNCTPPVETEVGRVYLVDLDVFLP